MIVNNNIIQDVIAMTDEQAGKILKSLCAYAMGDKESMQKLGDDVLVRLSVAACVASTEVAELSGESNLTLSEKRRLAVQKRWAKYREQKGTKSIQTDTKPIQNFCMDLYKENDTKVIQNSIQNDTKDTNEGTEGQISSIQNYTKPIQNDLYEFVSDSYSSNNVISSNNNINNNIIYNNINNNLDNNNNSKKKEKVSSSFEGKNESEKSENSAPAKDKINYQNYAEIWNTNTGKLPKIVSMSAARKSKLKTRIEEFKSLGEDPEETFVKICEKITSSMFLCGENDRGWKVTFDWLISNSTNWVKVIEGNYDRTRKQNSGKYRDEDYW